MLEPFDDGGAGAVAEQPARASAGNGVPAEPAEPRLSAKQAYGVATAGVEPQGEGESARQHWHLAAVLFIGGGLGAIPSDYLHQPAHPPTIYLLPLLALVSGLICLLIAERASSRGLHAMLMIATLEVALTAALADPLFAVYYVFVALFAGYVFHSRRAIAFHVGFASLAVLAPIAYDPDQARDTLLFAFALIPTLVLAAASVTLLRERLEASEQRYRLLAERDALTGVGNYRMLGQAIPRMLERQRQDDGTLTLIVIDLDDFKAVNDVYGHQRGDEVLQQVGDRLTATVRPGDLVVRQGGDEFCVVAPGIAAAVGEELALRLRAAIATIDVDGEGLGAGTGAASFPADGDTLEALLGVADDRLRGSKGFRPFRG